MTTATATGLTVAGPSSADFSDWDLYKFALGVGARTLPVVPGAALRRLILPVEYVRCVENRYVLAHLDVKPGHSVLDVGSPKILSVFLAARVAAAVWATDLLDYFFRSCDAYAACALGKAARERYHMEAQDARRLGYADGAFDRVFSISAIEHIPDDGDLDAVREIARVLKPGGMACLTVPWSDRGHRDVYKAAGDPDAYWISGHGEPAFYQREYDGASLRARLVAASGLELVDLSFFGEARVAMERALISRKLPRLFRYAMLPAHFPLSRIFLRPLREGQPSRKKVAALTLRKPAAGRGNPCAA